MPRLTLQERLSRALVARGHNEVLSVPSRKFRVFRHERPGLFYFVGRAGALRIGQVVSRSRTSSEALRKILLSEVPA